MSNLIYDNTLLVGIDYSYSCPSIICLEYNSLKNFLIDDIKTLIITQPNKKNNNLGKNLTYISFKEFKCDMDKFIFIADESINFIKSFNYNKIYCAMEDYSFSSHGRTFTIGENCALMKERLFKNKIPLKLYSPTLIKRFAKEQNEELAVKCSEGKLKKDGTVRIDTLKKNAMHEIFCWKFNIDLCDYFHMKKYVSPLADIVDALWILYIFWLETKIRVNDINYLTDQEIEFVRNGVDGVGLHTKPFVF